MLLRQRGLAVGQIQSRHLLQPVVAPIEWAVVKVLSSWPVDAPGEFPLRACCINSEKMVG